MKKPELLAPAGNLERLKTAIAFGADAVLSAKSFGGGGTLGSEDFAYISRQVPSLMLALAAGEPSRGYKYPLHHPKADFDENVLPSGAAALAYTAVCGLENQ